MSRSYRVSVQESQNRVIRAEDRVSTQLELLEVLPPEQMAALLEQELKARGFEKVGEVLVRKEEGMTISVDPKTATVTVSVEASEEAVLEGERQGRAYDDVGPHATQVKQGLQKDLQKELDRKAEEKTAKLQGKVTDQLEGHLGDIRQELDQVINRVTAEALKIKAAQLGQIKELTEDPEAGSLTIVVEV
jgi:hypothetical protein